MNRHQSVAAGLAALTLLAVGGVAKAQDQRIEVGDLSQPAQLAAFNHSLDRAVTNLCGSRWDNISRMSAYRACAAAVREEALDQLSPVHRQQFAAATNPGLRLASSHQPVTR